MLNDYPYNVAVTINGVRFTGPGCETESEAESLKRVLGTESTLHGKFEVTSDD